MIVQLLDLVSHFGNYDSGGDEDSSSSSDDDDLASSTVGTVKSDFGWDYPTITGWRLLLEFSRIGSCDY